MEKGVNQYWTPEKEAYFKRVIKSAHSSAYRFIATSVRNALKYDGRSREAKKATAKLRLMLASATDDDLVEIANLQHELLGGSTADERLEELIEAREKIRASGLPRELIGG